MNNDQPTEAQETANAAYLLRVSVQADLVNVANERNAKPETVKWHFERYWAAVERERRTEEEAKAVALAKAEAARNKD